MSTVRDRAAPAPSPTSAWESIWVSCWPAPSAVSCSPTSAPRVIKIEQPGLGDPMREWGREKPHGLSLWWPVIARNKKSIELNAREKDGQGADQAPSSPKPTSCSRTSGPAPWRNGPRYEELAKINPRIVMGRGRATARPGPMPRRRGYGAIGEALGGLRYVVGDPRRRPRARASRSATRWRRPSPASAP